VDTNESADRNEHDGQHDVAPTSEEAGDHRWVATYQPAKHHTATMNMNTATYMVVVAAPMVANTGT
jgi:hypothetical protein